MQPTVTQKWKIKALQEKVKQCAYKVPFVATTETHFKPGHLAAEIGIEDYNVQRADRITRKNGGAALYYHNNFIANDSVTYSDDYCQAVTLYIKSLNFIISCVYRPPNSKDCEVKSFKDCINQIDTFMKKYPNTDFQMYGDLNFRFINWDTLSLKPGHCQTLSEQGCANILLEFMENNLLSQHVQENTRKNQSILDLVITNNAETIHSITVETTNMSDHDIVITRIQNENLMANEKQQEYNPDNQFDKINFIKAKWDEMRSELASVDWKELLENKDVDDMCLTINDKVAEVANNNCPKHKIIKRKNDNIPRERRSLIRTRKHINGNINHLKYVKTVQTELEIKNRDNKVRKLEERKAELENQIKQSIINEEKQKEEEALRKIKINPRAFYSYANRKRKCKCRIGPLIDHNGNLQSDLKTMSDLLQEQYVKVFSEPEEQDTETQNDNVEENEDSPSLEDIEFDEEDIIKAINSMPNHSAPGPDKFPSILLKQCKNELATPLYILWRKSLDTGQVPKILKQQSIVPIYKKGSKAKPENYRPVSLTSHILKLFERVLRAKIVEFIETENKLSNEQYGFRPGRSTITQLLVHIENIIQILEKHGNADILYLDFSKAFDKVCHQTLLRKLEGYNIKGKVLKWIESFLSDRYQKVVVQGVHSEPEKVKSGVPQGTVLGPVLFILYINNITEVIRNSACKIFADDSKLVKCIKNEEDKEMLLADLQAVMDWADINKMELNESKFMLLQHGNNEEAKTPYKISETVTIEKAEYAKDLGILVDEDLKWSQQIATATASAAQLVGWIMRVFQSRTKEVVLMLHKSLVRPKVEYGCVVWHPHLISDIAKLESVQRTITARIEGMEQYNYWERLQHLGLYSLQRRRERYLCIHMFKIYSGILPNNLELSFYESYRHGPKCRRKTLIAQNSKINTIRCNSFSDVGATLFNVLPKQIKAAKTVESFKSRLDKMFRSLPDCPPIQGYVRRNNNSIRDWLLTESTSSWRMMEHDDDLNEVVEQQSLTQPAS